MIECLVNGELSRHLPVGDRGLHYGDGVFETVAVFRSRPRFWQGHMDRLADGCSRLGLDAPAQEILLRELATVSTGHARCVVKIIVTRGEGGRAYLPPETPNGNRMVSAHEWPVGADAQAQHGIKARTCGLRLGIQPSLGGLKHLNRLEQVLAAREIAALPDAHTGILLDGEGMVVSALSGNLFLVSGNQLLTPRLDRCGVRGVMRGAILKAFKPRCEQRRIHPDMLAEADEVFTCNAIRGIQPVVQLDDFEWRIGPVTREVQAWLQELGTA